MSRFYALLSVVGCAFALSACEPAPTLQQFAPISFADRTPIALDVASIDIVDEYRSSGQPPHVEHLFPILPQHAMHQWVNDRLKARGKDKRLQVIIKDASVVAEKLPVTKGIKGKFTNDQDTKFSGRVAMELRIYGDRAISLASTEVNAVLTQTIAENASLAEREQLYYNMTKGLMQNINAELEKNIQLYFANFYHYDY